MRTNIFSEQGMKKLTAKPVVDNSIPNYHEKSQAFIKGAKSTAMNVTAEDGELIASPIKKLPMVKKVATVKKMELKPTYKIPDQGKLKSSGAGWGGEPPVKKGRSTSTGYMPR